MCLIVSIENRFHHQQMFDSIFEDGSLQEYISQNIQDPWIGTPLEGYVFMSPKQKGEFGEQFVSKYFEQMGSEVKRAKTSTAGHDRVIDKILVEIKFALACRGNKNKKKVIKDKFVINHISKDKDWERLVFFGINPTEEECRLFWFTKEDFLNKLKIDDHIFKHQQGGKKIGNDDFICTKVNLLLECGIIRSINEW